MSYREPGQNGLGDPNPDNVPGDNGFSANEMKVINTVVRGASGYLPQSWNGKALLFDGSVVDYAGVVPANVSGVTTQGIDPLAYAYWQYGGGWQRQATERYLTTMVSVQQQMEKAAGRVSSGSAEQPGGAGGGAPPAPGGNPTFPAVQFTIPYTPPASSQNLVPIGGTFAPLPPPPGGFTLANPPGTPPEATTMPVGPAPAPIDFLPAPEGGSMNVASPPPTVTETISQPIAGMPLWAWILLGLGAATLLKKS